jgi:polynucleotide 5'-kinase involved in rRNA processing
MRTYLSRPKIVPLAWEELNLVEAPIGGGAALDVKSDSHLRHLRTPEMLWAEQRDGELHVVLPSRLSPAVVAELARAVGMRIRTWLAEELHGTLLGLLDEAGETVGIGILQHIDFAYHRLEVLTAEGIAGIRGVHWSRTRMGPSGDLHHVLSTAR